jgi:hypothetical protein
MAVRAVLGYLLHGCYTVCLLITFAYLPGLRHGGVGRGSCVANLRLDQIRRLLWFSGSTIQKSLGRQTYQTRPRSRP